MKAAVLHEGGRIVVEERPEPGGSVVDVRAAGVNFADVLIRRGLYPQMPELPYVLGSEVAGELDGRRVLAFTRINGGGYAERVAVDPEWTFALPDGASSRSRAAPEGSRSASRSTPTGRSTSPSARAMPPGRRS